MIAAILIMFGSGPIKGFGLTFFVGVLLSFFSAITASKFLLMFSASFIKSPWMYGVTQKSVEMKKSGGEKVFNFVGKRIIALCLSCAVFAFGIISFVIWGPTMDVQFEGGTLLQIETASGEIGAATAETEDFVRTVLNKNATVQVLQTLNQAGGGGAINVIQIKIAKSEGILTTGEINTLLDALIEDPRFVVPAGAEPEIQSIDASIGAEVRNRGFLAVGISFIIIVLYIAVRYKIVSGVSMGVTGVIGLLHDALVVLSVYIIFRIPINESFIAGILTILAYSINATIIIYDRIRENSQYKRKAGVDELVNASVSHTMTRTVYTTLTSLFAVGAVYVFALIYNIPSVMYFSFPIMLGMISGAYSSVFTVPAWWAWWRKRSDNIKKLQDALDVETVEETVE